MRFAVPDRENATTLFWAFVSIHAIVWTALPILSQPNGHTDVIELLNWGRHPQWGYWKHPPLQAWALGVAASMTVEPLWGVYLASQIANSACFWAVWLFARDFLNPAYSLLSVLLLEGIPNYTSKSPKFEHDALQLPLWALTVLLLRLALKSGRLRYWLMCGVAIGLGLLSKYSIVFLLAPLSIFMLVNADARRHFATPGPYITASTAALIVAPHVAWLIRNDFPTVTYALTRAESHGRLIDHLVNPLGFALNQVIALIPAMILMALLMVGSTSDRRRPAPAHSLHGFLFTVALGPFLALLAVSALTGFRLHSGWGRPLWSFIGVLALSHVQPAVTDKAFRRFSFAFLGCAAIWGAAFAGKFALGPTLTGNVRPEHFPGQAIATYVTTQWVTRYRTPVPAVGGNKWFADNVGFYSPDRPDVYADLNPNKNPWITDELFNRRGGVIIWDAVKDGNRYPGSWRDRFPRASVQPGVSFAWQTSAAVPPVELGWAIVPPATSGVSP
jgi:hypothetical protein